MTVPSSWPRQVTKCCLRVLSNAGESSAFCLWKGRGNVVTTLPAENEGSLLRRSRKPTSYGQEGKSLYTIGGRKRRAISDQACSLASLESPLPSAFAGIEGSARRWGNVLPQTSALLPPDPSSPSALRVLTGTWWPAAVPAPVYGEPLSWQR